MTERGDSATDATLERVGVFVLGMHRSGTSATTRAINLLGVPTCVSEDYMPGLEGNPRGHYESSTLVGVNTSVLAERGYSWTSPPAAGALDLSRTTLSVDAARAAFDAAHPTAQWVAKDPRTCLTLPFWLRVITARPVVIVVNRNPVDIAASLDRRNAFTKRFALALWERYMRNALLHARGLPALVVSYDELMDDPTRWCTEAATFLHSVGLRLDADVSSVAASLESRLRHSRYGADALRADATVSPAQVAIYEAVCERMGASSAFEPPSLPPEDARIERTIRVNNRTTRRAVRRLRRTLRSAIRRAPSRQR